MAKQIVYDNWITFNKDKEGYLNYMYVDQKNLVTTGMGDLIDDGSPAPALGLNWRRNSDNGAASESEIESEWYTMKNAGLANTGGGNQKSHTSLHLPDADITSLITEKLKEMESIIVGRYPSFESWPADAQMGILSMAWAMGPAFNFPKFQVAANQAIPDFVTMAAQSFIPSLGSGDGGRNSDNAILFQNAANVLAENADPNTLFWPGQVVATVRRTIIGTILGFFLGGLGLVGYNWIAKPKDKIL